MPLRLGLEELETEYIPELLYAIRLRQSLGLIGGQPPSIILPWHVPVKLHTAPSWL